MRYRVHRIKAGPLENFRWAAHTGGLAVVKAKDYETGCELEAVSLYAAWKRLADDDAPLRPGDLLEALDQTAGPVLKITKYIGFEPAQWFIPELKPGNSSPVQMDDVASTSNSQPILGNIS
jgi:hypothetical protein